MKLQGLRILFVLLLAFSWQYTLASKQIDSLRTQLSLTQDDSVYVSILNQLSKLNRWEDPVVAMDYAVKAEKLSQANNNKLGLALAYHNIGAIYADKANNELALEYHFKSLRIRESLGNKASMANSYGNIGLIYRRDRNYDKALKYHDKSLSIKKELADSMGIAYSYGNIGLIYSDQGKWDKALVHFYNSLRIKESLNDQYGIANSYGNIGVIYMKIGNLEQARINLERGLKIFQNLKNKSGIAESLLYLGSIYSEAKEYPQAIDAFNSCLKTYKDNGNLKGMADAHIKLGNIYSYLGKDYMARDDFFKSLEYYQKLGNKKGIIISKYELAEFYMKQGFYDKARVHLEQALRMAKHEDLNEETYKITILLAGVELKKGAYKQSALLLSEGNRLADTIFSDKLIHEVAQVQMEYEFEKLLQQRDFDEQKRQIENELKIHRIRQVRNISIIALLIVVVLSIALYKNMLIVRSNNVLLKRQKTRISDQLIVLKDQKDQLEKANQTKDKFISIVGHDLKNPFNSINSFVSLLTESDTVFNEEQFMHYISLIKDAGINANSLLDNLLEWAMNQSGGLMLQKEEVALNYILRGNTMLIKELAHSKNIDIHEILPGNPIVNMDKNMLNTIVRNLISNAMKFTPSGGTINVKSQVKEDMVKVSVSDTGIGISTKALATLFEPGVAKKGVDGLASSGLGLILCVDFLQKHNIELRVESKVEQGTTFWFKIPVTQ